MHKKNYIKNKQKRFKELTKNNSKIIENYFFMTALQIISALFGILIYPYLIRKLGSESYGLYIFSLSITSYFTKFISFGFDLPAVKSIIQNKDDIHKVSNIVSSVILSKTYLASISSVLFIMLILMVPLLNENKYLLFICFIQIIGEVLNPVWYFQAVQKMRIITYIQLGFKLFTLPFILIFINNPTDCAKYAIITSLATILVSISSIIFLSKREKIIFKFIPRQDLTIYFKNALPFFWSSSLGTIKNESITIIIGSFFGMRDVAIYDLANKIISVPRTLTMSINGAIFPRIIKNAEKRVIKKIIKFEGVLGLLITIITVLFGKWIITLLGGENMIGAYPLTIILSGTVGAWLVVSCYHNFIFIPHNKYYFITKNQFVAFATFLIICIPGVLIFDNSIVLAAAFTISGMSELIYSKYLIKKYKLL